MMIYEGRVAADSLPSSGFGDSDSAGGGVGIFFASFSPCLYKWNSPANTIRISPVRNSAKFFIPLRAALYAAMLRYTWNANSPTINQFIHFPERLIGDALCGPFEAANFAFLSDSFASNIIIYENPNPIGTSNSIIR